MSDWGYRISMSVFVGGMSALLLGILMYAVVLPKVFLAGIAIIAVMLAAITALGAAIIGLYRGFNRVMA